MRTFGLGRIAPVWDGADGGAGGGAGGAPAGGAGAGGDGSGAWTPPQGLPAEFTGKDAGETLGKLLGGYQQLNTRFEGLRTDLAQRPGPGKTPDEYVFTPDEALKPFFPDVAKDPILPFAREAFQKAGVPTAAFQPIISEIYSKAIAAGVLQAPYSPAQELQSFMELNGITDKTAAQQHLVEADQFATGLAKQLQVPKGAEKDVAAALAALTDTAAGNIALRAIRARLTASGINIPLEGSGAPGGPMTDDEFKQLGSDPRIDPRNEGHKDPNVRFDPALRKRWDDKSIEIGRRAPARS